MARRFRLEVAQRWANGVAARLRARPEAAQAPGDGRARLLGELAARVRRHRRQEEALISLLAVVLVGLVAGVAWMVYAFANDGTPTAVSWLTAEASSSSLTVGSLGWAVSVLFGYAQDATHRRRQLQAAYLAVATNDPRWKDITRHATRSG